jgi:exosortase A-associated hydrolase 1
MGAPMRTLIEFDCAGEKLAGTLDPAEGATGLLIVSGGNEIRIGAHRGMAMLAARLAERGIPVFRFDRRGIGDSSGTNGGYASSGPDIAAAVAVFRRHAPAVERIVGFGNCDAATALVLFGDAAGIDRLILSNPWVVEPTGDLPPPAAIRARYAARLRDPHEWRRLLTGGVNISKLIEGLRHISARPSQHSDDLASRFFSRLPGDAAVILATRDATAQAFGAAARAHRWAGTIVPIDSASHSYARRGDGDALFAAIIAAL